MKFASKMPFKRTICYSVLVLGFTAVAYFLSIGPASAWVANTVSGQSQIRAEIYDARLAGFFRFYAPLFKVQLKVHWSRFYEIEGYIVDYELWFHRARRLVDGRYAFTVPYALSDDSRGLTPQEVVNKFLTDNMGVELHPGTQAFFLARTNRLLVIVDPADEHVAQLNIEYGSPDPSFAPGASLELP